jgi:hypothetical protein
LKEKSMLVKIYGNGKDCAWYHVSVNTTSQWTGKGSDLKLQR